MTKPTLLVVTGMSRGDNSVLQAIVSVGAKPFDSGLSADHTTPNGAAEPRSIASLCSNYLDQIGRTWRDFRGFPKADEQEVGNLVEGLVTLLSAAHLSETLCVLDEPSLGRLLPILESALHECGLGAVYIIALDAPGAAAASLMRSDRLSQCEAEALWARNMLEVEQHTRGRKRAFVNCRQLAEDPVQALLQIEKQLTFNWPVRPEDNSNALLTVFSERCPAPEIATKSAMSDLAADVYDALVRLDLGSDDADALRCLGRQSATLEQVSDGLAHLLLLAPLDHSRDFVVAALQHDVEKALQAQKLGAREALDIVNQLPTLAPETRLRALTADVDDLVHDLTVLQQRPLLGIGRYCIYAALRLFEKFSPLMSAERSARLGRSCAKRDPRRYQLAWSGLRSPGVVYPSIRSPRDQSAQKTPANAPKLAVVIHAFYPDVLDEILLRFRLVEKTSVKFYITCEFGKDAQIKRICDAYGIDATVCQVENRGRDVLPFLRLLPLVQAEGHDVILKLHTKKSLHQSNGRVWRSAVMSKLISPDIIDRATEAFHAEKTLGVIAPDAHILDLRTFVDTNGCRIEKLLDQASISRDVMTNGFFVAGTMMFIRTALAVKLSADVDASAFEPEAGQTEGTMAHAIERLFCIYAKAAGFQIWSTDMKEIHHGKMHYDYVRASTILQNTREIVLSGM